MADYEKERLTEEYISSLQRRLELLEQRLIGDEKVREGQPPLLYLLKTIDRKLKALVKSGQDGGETVFSLWKKLPQLERVLDPLYLSSLKLNEPGAQELLLCYADQLQKYQQDIDDLHHLKDAINSSSLQGLESTEKDLSRLASVHLQQEEQVTCLAKRVQSFVDSYGKFLLRMSSQCIEWEETLSQVEGQS